MKKDINENVWLSFSEFLDKIPKISAHYYNNNLDKKYFENLSLNIKTLFKLFNEFYSNKTKRNLDISIESFRNYFTNTYNIGFRKLRNYFCDFHFKIEKLGKNISNEDKILFEKYK